MVELIVVQFKHEYTTSEELEEKIKLVNQVRTSKLLELNNLVIR